jgi:hypothetical protein
MNSKVALLLGFIIGIAATTGGMYLSARAHRPAPAAPSLANIPVKELTAATNERRARGPNWWDMDAPTPDVPPPRELQASVITVTNIVNGEPRVSTNHVSRGDDWRNMSEAERQQRFTSFWSNQIITARASFVSNAVLTQDEATRFDVLTTAMNLRLAQRLDPLVEKYQAGWRPTPEERTRLMQDVSQVIVSTYDEMDRNMPADWRDGVTNSYFSLTQFVDPKYMPFTRGLSGWHGPPGGGFGGPPGGPPQTTAIPAR